MKKIFIDANFNKIAEGRDKKITSAWVTKAKLEQLEEIRKAIQSTRSEEAVQNILSYREVKRSLEQCLEFIENSHSSVTNADFVIYLSYAETQLKEADLKLSRLEL